MFGKAINFLKESREELNRVIWPTREATIKMVMTVILLCIIVSIFLGAIDFGFLTLIKNFIG